MEHSIREYTNDYKWMHIFHIGFNDHGEHGGLFIDVCDELIDELKSNGVECKFVENYEDERGNRLCTIDDKHSNPVLEYLTELLPGITDVVALLDWRGCLDSNQVIYTTFKEFVENYHHCVRSVEESKSLKDKVYKWVDEHRPEWDIDPDVVLTDSIKWLLYEIGVLSNNEDKAKVVKDKIHSILNCERFDHKKFTRRTESVYLRGNEDKDIVYAERLLIEKIIQKKLGLGEIKQEDPKFVGDNVEITCSLPITKDGKTVVREHTFVLDRLGWDNIYRDDFPRYAFITDEFGWIDELIRNNDFPYKIESSHGSNLNSIVIEW
jgi:hypothetical protein